MTITANRQCRPSLVPWQISQTWDADDSHLGT